MDIETLNYLVADDNLGLLRDKPRESHEDYINRRIELARDGFPVLQRAWDKYVTFIEYNREMKTWFFATYTDYGTKFLETELIDEATARFSLT